MHMSSRPTAKIFEEQRHLGGSGGRGERLALLDHIGRREDRLRRPVLATVRHSRRHLKSLARRERARALPVNGEIEPPFDEIVRLDVNSHLHSDVAVCRAIGLLDERTFEAGCDDGFSFRSGRRQKAARCAQCAGGESASCQHRSLLPLRRAALAWLFFPKSAGRLPFEGSPSLIPTACSDVGAIETTAIAACAVERSPVMTTCL